MLVHWVFYVIALNFIVVDVSGQNTRVAIAHLVSQNVTGTVTFSETERGLQVIGNIIGLSEGHYGFHVHELGDTSTCYATGAHFDPDGNNHGGREHEVRHVGDLGNVYFEGNGSARFIFVDSIISLHGRNSILGRALVLHAQEDDLGLGGDAASLTTGNAGPRLACGVIGILSPEDPWNSANLFFPSTTLLLLGWLFVIFLGN